MAYIGVLIVQDIERTESIVYLDPLKKIGRPVAMSCPHSSLSRLVVARREGNKKVIYQQGKAQGDGKRDSKSNAVEGNKQKETRQTQEEEIESRRIKAHRGLQSCDIPLFFISCHMPCQSRP